MHLLAEPTQQKVILVKLITKIMKGNFINCYSTTCGLRNVEVWVHRAYLEKCSFPLVHFFFFFLIFWMLRITLKNRWKYKVGQVAQLVKNLPAMQETQVQSLGGEDPLAESMATHSSILAWKIPRTEEPGGLQFVGSQRVGHDIVFNHHLYVI